LRRQVFHDPPTERNRVWQTDGVVERFFDTLKYEYLYRGAIGNGDALSAEVNWFRQISAADGAGPTVTARMACSTASRSPSKVCCCAVQNTTLFSSVTAWLVCCPKRDRRSVPPPMLRGHIA
jgi:hypothetical protein